MLRPIVAKTSRYLLLGGGAAVGTAAAYRYRNVLKREANLLDKPINVFATSTTNDEEMNKKRVVIIGGGVVGVTAAYKLAQAGHDVAILEPRNQAASECSACAAGGMQRSNPVVDRDSWIGVTKCIAPKFITRLLFRDDKHHYDFFHIDWFQTLSDPFFLRWVLTFTKTSLFPDKHQDEKQVQMLKFTKFAVDDMVNMMENRKDNMSAKSGYNSKGSMSVSYEPVQQEETQTKGTHNPSSSKMSYEPGFKLIGEQVIEEEPSLMFQKVQPTNAKYEYESKSASSERFTLELADRCVNDPKLNVSILYDTRVQAMTTVQDNQSGKPRISQLKTNQGVIKVPKDAHVVVCAGAWTPHVLALCNLYAPVYPLKGYAMSVSAKEALATNPTLKDKDLPSRIVSDKYMYTTRLGEDEIRITSVGEFSGWNTQPTPKVDMEFRNEAIRQFPQLQTVVNKASTRCGHRPFVSDGILLLGAVDTHHNLYVSCGPGSNGWKLAMGSGEVIKRLVEGQTEEQIGNDLKCNVSAFSPSNRVLNAPLFAKLCRARWGV